MTSSDFPEILNESIIKKQDLINAVQRKHDRDKSKFRECLVSAQNNVIFLILRFYRMETRNEDIIYLCYYTITGQ